MKLNLEKKVVAITGGTSGIGAELAFAFAEEGCSVSICGRSQDKIDALTKEFSSKGFALHAKSVDVRELDQLREYIEEVGDHFGHFDILINNAGIPLRKQFDQVSENEFHNLIDTDFKSVYFGSAFAAEQMRKFAQGGVIINTSSFASLIPTAGITLYSSIKAAVDKLTAALATELAADNIRVVSVQPGMTVTPMTTDYREQNYANFVNLIPMRRLATPDDVIGAYLFLASDAASYINGISLAVSGARLATQNPQYSYRDKNNNW